MARKHYKKNSLKSENLIQIPYHISIHCSLEFHTIIITFQEYEIKLFEWQVTHYH